MRLQTRMNSESIATLNLRTALNLSYPWISFFRPHSLQWKGYRSQFRTNMDLSYLSFSFFYLKFFVQPKIQIERYAFYALRIYGCLDRCSGMMNLGVDQHGPRPIRPWQERIHAFLERTAHAAGKHLSWPGRKCEGKKGFLPRKLPEQNH